MYQTYINPEGTILKVCELSMLKEINHFKCTFPWSLTGVFAWACSGTFQLQAWIALKLFFGVVDVFWHWGPDQDPKIIVLFGDVAPGNAPIQLGTGHNYRTINMQILHEQHQHDNLWKPVGINLSMSSSAKKGIFGKREDPGCSTAHHICRATHKSMSSAALPKCMLDFLTLSREMSPNISNNVPRFDVPSDTQIKSEHGIPSQHRDPGRSRRTPLIAANMPGLRTPTQ